MKKDYKFWILSAAASIIFGAVIFLALCLVCRYWMSGYIAGLPVEENARVVWRLLGGAVGFTSAMWFMTLRVRKKDRQDSENALEAERERLRNIHGGNYTATLFELFDDNHNKESFTLYGERVRPGRGAGPMFILWRFLSVLCTFFAVVTCFVTLCMLLSVT